MLKGTVAIFQPGTHNGKETHRGTCGPKFLLRLELWVPMTNAGISTRTCTRNNEGINENTQLHVDGRRNLKLP